MLRLIGWLFIALLTTGYPAPFAFGDGTPTLTRAQRQTQAHELKRLRARIATVRKEFDTLRGQHDAARRALRRVELAIGRIARNLHHSALRLGAVQRRLNTLQTKASRLRARLDLQRRLLADQVRAAFAIGHQEYLKLLLNQQDPAALGRVMTYYGYFSRARAKRIRAVLDTLTQISQIATDIHQQTTDLHTLQARQQQDKRRLDARYRERAQVVARLHLKMNTKGQELARLVANEKRLDHLLRALNQAMADIPAEPDNHPPFWQLKGRLPWPTQGTVQNLYGRHRLGNINWNGAIIHAPQGRAVHAISHGRVAFADWLRGYGLLMIIDHGNGYMTLYGHNQALYKETGDWVEPGDVIATVGDSGGANVTGLYFEIRHNGRPIDPGRWCRQTRQRRSRGS